MKCILCIAQGWVSIVFRPVNSLKPLLHCTVVNRSDEKLVNSCPVLNEQTHQLSVWKSSSRLCISLGYYSLFFDTLTYCFALLSVVGISAENPRIVIVLFVSENFRGILIFRGFLHCNLVQGRTGNQQVYPCNENRTHAMITG